MLVQQAPQLHAAVHCRHSASFSCCTAVKNSTVAVRMLGHTIVAGAVPRLQLFRQGTIQSHHAFLPVVAYVRLQRKVGWGCYLEIP